MFHNLGLLCAVMSFTKSFLKCCVKDLRLSCIPSLISHGQSAFIEGSIILHNIFLCQDIMKHYRRKNQPSRCTIKVDLHKAYDSINWNSSENCFNACTSLSSLLIRS